MLHRLIYISAICGVIHYYWLVKSAVIRPLTYGVIVGLLFAWRVGEWFVRRRHAAHASAAVARPTPIKVSQ
jgi:sulfoxide reductase heme-binding subunit YedZ